MASTTIGSSGVTFPDATTQSTAPVNTSANVNSVSAGTGISVSGTTGAVTVTNSGVTSVTAGTGISVSASTGGVTITNTSSASGTVTSVATGNGLSGGTITSSGTLTIACPSANSIGSYCYVKFGGTNNGYPTLGNNYSAGTGGNQITQAFGFDGGGGFGGYTSGQSLSGTWKWMGQTNVNSISQDSYAIACRVA